MWIADISMMGNSLNSELVFKWKLHVFITLGVMVFIFVHSAMPGEMSGAESNFVVRIVAAITGLPADEPLRVAVRKAAHFTEFMLLGGALELNMRDYLLSRSHSYAGWKRLIVPWFAGTLYAVTDEIHQIFVPGRACALTDVCIDSAGVLVGILVLMLVMFCSQGK